MKCGKHCRNLCGACILQTLLFPVEHVIWKYLSPLLGISF